jgi:hypothetical protein
MLIDIMKGLAMKNKIRQSPSDPLPLISHSDLLDLASLNSALVSLVNEY